MFENGCNVSGTQPLKASACDSAAIMKATFVRLFRQQVLMLATWANGTEWSSLVRKEPKGLKVLFAQLVAH